MSQKTTLILSSNSPRRKELLRLGGWEFGICAVEVDETPYPAEDPRGYVLRMAEAKARAGAKNTHLASDLPCLVIGADTTVVDPAVGTGCKETILGKPADGLDAVSMLRRLRGREHFVYTAIAVFRREAGILLSDVCSTAVRMRAYSDVEIETYVHSGDPLDKAGAYAIQHPQFNPVASIDGCFANVVGMPLCKLASMLQHMGISSVYQYPDCHYEACPVCQKLVQSGRMNHE